MADNNYSLGTINLGLGGLGDALTQQVKDDEQERKRKLVSLGLNKQPNQASSAGLGTFNIFELSGG